MATVFVKNGTPVGASSLCETCSYAQIMRGYGMSEIVVRCLSNYEEPIFVPFKVRDCSSYNDKNRPSYAQMKDLALVLNEGTTSKPAGFLRSSSRFVEDDDEEEFAASS